MTKEIWFDMDGTIADLYGVENWLEKLKACDPSPYANAKPLVRLATLARVLNNLQKTGWKIGVVSWLSKNSTKEYAKAVTAAKMEWLKIHMASVKFDNVDIIDYGTPKYIGRDGILFDDEEKNRKEWRGQAYGVNNILEILKELKGV